MKNIYSTLFEKGQHSFSLQSLMRTLLLCFFIAAATNGQAHEVDNIDYELRTDGTAWVKNGKKAQGDVTILSKIEVDGKEYTVVGIYYNAFSSNESITSVTLPDNLKYINYGAFSYCYNLENINNIPKHIENLGEAVFSRTKFLDNGIKNEFFVFSDWLIEYTPQGETAKVTVPEGIFGIAAYALTDAEDTVVLPKSLRAVSATAFNSNLKHIDTGDNPVYAYKDGILFCEGTETFCKNGRDGKDEVSVDGMWADVILSNAVKNGVLLIPGKVETAGNVVKTVGGVRKSELPRLTCEKLIVDEGVKYIIDHAFRFFKPLQYVDLPSTLINIGGFAFVDAKIESLVCRMPQPMNVPYYFTYFIKEFNSKVYVPKALLDTYKTTKTNWNLIPAENFYQIEGNVPESGILASVKPIESVGKATVKAIYTLNGTKVNSLQHGINIVKMSDGTVRKVMTKGYKNR
nr:leucine-rich repeat domain-containing protein [Prevotella sp.]